MRVQGSRGGHIDILYKQSPLSQMKHVILGCINKLRVHLSHGVAHSRGRVLFIVHSACSKMCLNTETADQKGVNSLNRSLCWGGEADQGVKHAIQICSNIVISYFPILLHWSNNTFKFYVDTLGQLVQGFEVNEH